MGIYLNPGNEAFRQWVTDELYVDKTEMISLMNQKLNKNRVKYICVSRPRRFGKSMAADMLAAYYGKGCDSRELFAGRKIEREALLIHLGYLTYDEKTEEAFIPKCVIEKYEKQ